MGLAAQQKGARIQWSLATKATEWIVFNALYVALEGGARSWLAINGIDQPKVRAFSRARCRGMVVPLRYLRYSCFSNIAALGRSVIYSSSFRAFILSQD